jgi:hypothetical protein
LLVAKAVEGAAWFDVVGKPVGTSLSGVFMRFPASAYGVEPPGTPGKTGSLFVLGAAVPPAIDAFASGVARDEGGVG